MKPPMGALAQHGRQGATKIFLRTRRQTQERCIKFQVALMAVIVPILTTTPVFARAYLVKSVPAGRAMLYRSPAKIQLWFNERLEPKYSTAAVYGPDGQRVDANNAQVASDDPKQLSVALKNMPAGRYTVKFRVLSVDGHVVEQSFPFTVRQSK